MNALVVIIGLVALVLIGGAALWRRCDHRADIAERERLIACQPKTPALFSLSMIAGLPEPTRRYFAFAIAPGTPLFTVADISMRGQFSLGTKDRPDYFDMDAEQTLATPQGSIWKMRAARGLLLISGSDSGNWVRFWLMGLLPVARSAGTVDLRRSAFGRYAAEAFWTPAVFLPGPGVQWMALSENTARVTISHAGQSQSVDLTVDTKGRPVQVVMDRWSDANPEKTFRIQPFGAYLSRYRCFSGFTVPTHIEAGNHFGTEDYFPFYIADVGGVSYPRLNVD